MKNIGEIKHSLTAVKQTRQITNAMYLLSVSEMKRYMNGVIYIVEYMQRLREIKRDLLKLSHGTSHPFKTSYTSSGRSAYIVISAEKGMCGSYNANIAALAEEKIKSSKEPYIIMKGTIAQTLLAAKGIRPDEKWEYPGNAPSIKYAADMAAKLINLYLSDYIDEVDIIYTKYISQIEQSARCYKILPLSNDVAEEAGKNTVSEIEFLPSEDEVFMSLARHYVTGIVYSAMYQSFVSEQVARMNAMKSATNNADDMIRDLTHKFNSLRQVAITNELTEITSAARCADNTEKR